MNITQKGIVTLIKSAITGETYELPKEFRLDAEETKLIIKRHHLMLLVYIGAVNCKIPEDLPMMKQLFAFYCKHYVSSERQMRSVQRVFDAFEEHQIDYLPTKGCNLKAIYPKPEMRSMGDADITIRKEQCAQIDELMPKLGFTPAERGPGTVVWDSPSLHLELHMHMNSFYNQKYYDDAWERVHLVSGHRYAFSVEDEFIHVFNHFARHYRGGGIGCRHLVDVYVLRRKYPQMDENYIYHEMKKIRLHEFYKNVLVLLEVWFADGEETPVTEQINDYIFSSGSWGSQKSHAAANQVVLANESDKKTNFKGRAIVSTIFPNLQFMQERYPFLDKAPYLLPFSWVMRWGRAIRVGKDHIPKLVREWDNIEDDKVLEYRDGFRMVGLDIDSSENN